MGVKVIEGRWEDVAPKVKLAGRNVRIVYQDGASSTITLAETAKNAEASTTPAKGDPWLKQLIDFSNSHNMPAHDVDLSRDRLFEELHGDRR